MWQSIVVRPGCTPMSDAPGLGGIQPVYLVIDASGSTALDNWIGRVNALLPALVEQLELADDRVTHEVRLSMLTFGTSAVVHMPLSATSAIEFIPAIQSGGFTSLSSAFHALAATIAEDASSLTADGYNVVPATACFVLQGLPTDPPDHLIEALAELEARIERGSLHAVCCAGTDPVALRGLGFTSPIYVGDTIDLSMLGASIARELVAAPRP